MLRCSASNEVIMHACMPTDVNAANCACSGWMDGSTSGLTLFSLLFTSLSLSFFFLFFYFFNSLFFSFLIFKFFDLLIFLFVISYLLRPLQNTSNESASAGVIHTYNKYTSSRAA